MNGSGGSDRSDCSGVGGFGLFGQQVQDERARDERQGGKTIELETRDRELYGLFSRLFCLYRHAPRSTADNSRSTAVA